MNERVVFSRSVVVGTTLLTLARSRTTELQLYAASAFAALAEAHAPKTPIVQAGAVPPLLALVRNGGQPRRKGGALLPLCR